MTTKDYEATARVFAMREREITNDNTQGMEVMRIALARDMADLFAADNSRFSRTQFLEACGV